MNSHPTNPFSSLQEGNFDPFTYVRDEIDRVDDQAAHWRNFTIDPEREEAYWRENYRRRPYVSAADAFERYQQAYRYGWEAFAEHREREFHELEPDLEAQWEQHRGKMLLGWSEAKPAVRDAWDRLEFALADTQELPPPKRR